MTSPVRERARLEGYDYASAGAYFVTIVTAGRRPLFADAVAVAIVQDVWDEIPLHFPSMETDEFVVMPNHVHGIILINERLPEAQHAAPLRQPGVAKGSLGAVVRSFKSEVTARFHRTVSHHGAVWQRNYYDLVVRNDKELNGIRDYILGNPLNWKFDFENPRREIAPSYERSWAWVERPKAVLA